MLLGMSATERTVFAVLRLRLFGAKGHHPCCDQHDKCKANGGNRTVITAATATKRDGAADRPGARPWLVTGWPQSQYTDTWWIGTTPLRRVDRPRIGEGPVVESCS